MKRKRHKQYTLAELLVGTATKAHGWNKSVKKSRKLSNQMKKALLDKQLLNNSITLPSSDETVLDIFYRTVTHNITKIYKGKHNNYKDVVEADLKWKRLAKLLGKYWLAAMLREPNP